MEAVMLRCIASLALFLTVTVVALAVPAPERVKTPRTLRILLFAGSPTREYQFVRSLLANESERKRVELSILLQPPPGKEKRRPGVVQDVPPERMLDTFPTKLDSYDVLVAFDPDWSRLTEEMQANLKKRIAEKGGGLIFLAGPIHTRDLARPGAEQKKFAPLRDLLPVVLLDPRVLENEIDTSKPRRLTFPKTKAAYPFLKLDDKAKERFAGWSKFFEVESDIEGKKEEARNGFFSYFPLASVKSDAVVLAALDDPKARMKDGKEQPYLVVWSLGKGRVLYVGSGELWRLRQYRRSYYERFWLSLLQNVTASH
jgi:hypothetical protein